MKIKYIFIVIFVLAFSVNSFSQVKISPDKITYKRTSQDVPDYKKTFDVNYPKIIGVKDSAITKNLEDTLSYWKTFDLNLEEEISDSYGLDSADFVVNYNKNSILDITLVAEVSGAYPSTLSKTKVIDLRTGKQVFIKDVFTNVGRLLQKIDNAKLAAEKKEIAELKKDSPEDAVALRRRLSDYENPINTLEEFSINDKGVTFKFDYGFPHVIKALAPDGNYFFTWNEIKPYIKPNGLLGQFIR